MWDDDCFSSVPFPSTICLGEKRYPASLRDEQGSQVPRKVTPVLGVGVGGHYYLGQAKPQFPYQFFVIPDEPW